MKYMIVFFALLTMSSRFSGSFFDLSFTGLDGKTVATSVLKGKKVIVFAFNGVHPDWRMLKSMDSIQRANADSVTVLAFPGLEFDSSASTQRVTSIRDSLRLQLLIAQPSRVTKASGTGQIPLFQWLTSVQGNGHFNRDVEEEGMLFVVSSGGTLYSIINWGLVGPVLPRSLRAVVKEFGN